MTRRIRAHFDGNVIVPDEPIDLPVNEPLQVEVTPLAPDDNGDRRAAIEDRLRRLAKVTGCISGPSIPDEALRRDNLYDEPV